MANVRAQLLSHGLSRGQVNYQLAHHPGMSASAILKARSRQLYLHNPQAFGPGTNLTPLHLNQLVGAAGTEKYGPALSQLKTQIGQVDPVYDAYKQALQTAQTQNQQQATSTYNAITGAAKGLESVDAQQRQALLQQMQADAASRGASVDPALFAAAQQASSARQAQANSQATLAQQQGNNAQTYLQALQGVSDVARQNRLGTLQQQQRDLLTQQGAFKTSQRQSLIDQAVKNAIMYGTLGVSQTNASTAAKSAASLIKNRSVTAKEKARHDLATEQNTANNPARQIDKAKLNYFNQHGYWPNTGPPKGGAGGPSAFTPTQLRKSRTTYRSALSWAKGHKPTPGEEKQLAEALMAPKGGSKPRTVTLHDPTTGKPIYNPDGTPKTVQKGGGAGGLGITDPLLARAISLMAIYGGVDAKTQRSILRNYGLRLPVQKAPSTGPFRGTGRNPGERPT